MLHKSHCRPVTPALLCFDGHVVYGADGVKSRSPIFVPYMLHLMTNTLYECSFSMSICSTSVLFSSRGHFVTVMIILEIEDHWGLWRSSSYCITLILNTITSTIVSKWTVLRLPSRDQQLFRQCTSRGFAPLAHFRSSRSRGNRGGGMGNVDLTPLITSPARSIVRTLSEAADLEDLPAYLVHLS